MHARIYKPSRTAMQSGKAKTNRWVLEYAPEVPLKADPLMGYTSSADMLRQVRLTFDTLEAARSYAERNGIPYRVSGEEQPKVRPASYADNFRYSRAQPWTH